VIRSVLTVLWFAVAIGGGLLVAVNFRGIAERIFDLIARYSWTGPGTATSTTIRIVGGGFAVLAVFGLGVIWLSHAQGH
jgi:hypothetical protein